MDSVLCEAAGPVQGSVWGQGSLREGGNQGSQFWLCSNGYVTLDRALDPASLQPPCPLPGPGGSKVSTASASAAQISSLRCVFRERGQPVWRATLFCPWSLPRQLSAG